MRRLELPGDRPLRLAVIGAHPDDIEIGAGGTILRLATERRLEHVDWSVLSGEAERRAEAERAATAFSAGAGAMRLHLGMFRDGYFPADYAAVKSFLHDLAPSHPDLVLVPRREDAHQDHRLLGELAWTVFRDSIILEYEIPKTDGDLVTPTVYVDLSAEIVERKIALLHEVFPSQRDRPWFTPDTFRSILRLRGVEARSASGYAEGFAARKLAL